MLCHSIYLQVVKVHLFKPGLPMNRYTFVLPSENQNAFACSLSAQMPFIMKYSHSRTSHRSEFFAKSKKNDKIQKEHLSLSLSLLVDLSMHFDFPWKEVHVPVSVSSLSIYICKNGLDPDQTRIEFRKECFVNLKNCACDRKYAKCCTKADAHDKMGFQYTSISLYIVRSHVRILMGDRGAGVHTSTDVW